MVDGIKLIFTEFYDGHNDKLKQKWQKKNIEKNK